MLPTHVKKPNPTCDDRQWLLHLFSFWVNMLKKSFREVLDKAGFFGSIVKGGERSPLANGLGSMSWTSVVAEHLNQNMAPRPTPPNQPYLPRFFFLCVILCFSDSALAECNIKMLHSRPVHHQIASPTKSTSTAFVPAVTAVSSLPGCSAMTPRSAAPHDLS